MLEISPQVEWPKRSFKKQSSTAIYTTERYKNISKRRRRRQAPAHFYTIHLHTKNVNAFDSPVKWQKPSKPFPVRCIFFLFPLSPETTMFLPSLKAQSVKKQFPWKHVMNFSHKKHLCPLNLPLLIKSPLSPEKNALFPLHTWINNHENGFAGLVIRELHRLIVFEAKEREEY